MNKKDRAELDDLNRRTYELIALCEKRNQSLIKASQTIQAQRRMIDKQEAIIRELQDQLWGAGD